MAKPETVWDVIVCVLHRRFFQPRGIPALSMRPSLLNRNDLEAVLETPTILCSFGQGRFA
jgi:hypothetical protein